MAVSDDFDGLLPVIGTFTITGPEGGAVAVNVYGCEDIKLPDREAVKDTYTPMSGARAMKEQILLGTSKSGTMEAKMTFQYDNYAALKTFVGKNGCAIVLQVNSTATAPGIKVTAEGGIEKLAFERWETSKHATFNFTAAVGGDWTDEIVEIVP